MRDLAGIPFPGITYPEVQRLAPVTVPDSVTLLENGDIEVAGVGRISLRLHADRARRVRRRSTNPELLGLYTSEEEAADYDDDEPMTVDELRDSIRRVLGVDLPLGEPTRLTRFTFHARQVERYRDGRILLAGDAAHLFPARGVALSVGLLDSVNLGWKLAADIDGWAPAGLLDTYHDERHLAAERTLLHTRAQVALRRGHDPAAVALRELFQELLTDEQPLRRIGALIAGTDAAPAARRRRPRAGRHLAPDLTLRTGRGAAGVAELLRTARPVLLDLADRADLREAAGDWQPRIEIRAADTDRPAGGLPADPPRRPHRLGRGRRRAHRDRAPALREALSRWFGAPLRATVPVGDRPPDGPVLAGRRGAARARRGLLRRGRRLGRGLLGRRLLRGRLLGRGLLRGGGGLGVVAAALAARRGRLRGGRRRLLGGGPGRRGNGGARRVRHAVAVAVLPLVLLVLAVALDWIACETNDFQIAAGKVPPATGAPLNSVSIGRACRGSRPTPRP